jgi:hypothetical protein
MNKLIVRYFNAKRKVLTIENEGVMEDGVELPSQVVTIRGSEDFAALRDLLTDALKEENDELI